MAERVIKLGPKDCKVYRSAWGYIEVRFTKWLTLKAGEEVRFEISPDCVVRESLE